MTDSKLIEKTANLTITESTTKTDQSFNDEGALQQFTHWEKDGDAAIIDDMAPAVGRRGWSVEEMFRMNKKLGVASTYKDDLTQYTT